MTCSTLAQFTILCSIKSALCFTLLQFALLYSNLISCTLLNSAPLYSVSIGSALLSLSSVLDLELLCSALGLPSTLFCLLLFHFAIGFSAQLIQSSSHFALLYSPHHSYYQLQSTRIVLPLQSALLSLSCSALLNWRVGKTKCTFTLR